MKKAIVFAALTMMSASAFASKARQAALNNAVSTNDDIQEAFINPAKIFNVGDLLTVEFGTQAEGGFIRSSGDTKYGIYFGNRSPAFKTLIDAANAAPFNAGLLQEQNPLEVFYGMGTAGNAWALSFKYASAEDKIAPTRKVNVMALRGGYNTEAFEVYANLGLAGKSEKDTVGTAQNDMTVRVGGEYFLGDSTIFADVTTGSGKVTPTGGNDTKISKMDYTLGVESKIKGDQAHVFYGAKVVSTETKTGDNGKETSMKLPVYAGLEADAASWLVLRGFVQQSVLLNSAKTVGATGTTTAENSGMDDASAGFGAGVKFGKLMVDGSLGTTGTLNTGSLLANMSLNYMF